MCVRTCARHTKITVRLNYQVFFLKSHLDGNISPREYIQSLNPLLSWIPCDDTLHLTSDILNVSEF